LTCEALAAVEAAIAEALAQSPIAGADETPVRKVQESEGACVNIDGW
jgi:hypothetical protein